MPQENVELVRESIARFAATRRETGLAAPDFVWDMTTFRGWPDAAEYRGVDEFLEFFRQWSEPYDAWTIEVEDARGAGERVVAVVRQRGRLEGTDSWVEARYGALYTIENGRIKRVQWYATPEEAFEAAGIRS